MQLGTLWDKSVPSSAAGYYYKVSPTQDDKGYHKPVSMNPNPWIGPFKTEHEASSHAAQGKVEGVQRGRRRPGLVEALLREFNQDPVGLAHYFLGRGHVGAWKTLIGHIETATNEFVTAAKKAEGASDEELDRIEDLLHKAVGSADVIDHELEEMYYKIKDATKGIKK